jgi:hypothetical protein
MIVIYKYKLLGHKGIIKSYDEARFIHFALQDDGIPCVWAMVDNDGNEYEYEYKIVGTGQKLTYIDKDNYIGTLQQGPFVWHLFIG